MGKVAVIGSLRSIMHAANHCDVNVNGIGTLVMPQWCGTLIISVFEEGHTIC